MQEGRARSEVPYRWASTLRIPAGPPRLVYLDLNRWVSLAKANSGHKDGQRFREALNALVDARRNRKAIFPISDSTFLEVSKIKQYRQRRDLRDVIEMVSGYFVITSRTAIATHEIEAALDELVGPSSRPINTMNYLDWGVARAFGKVGGFRAFDDAGADVTASARAESPQGPHAFDELLADAELQLIRNVLAGPSPDDEPQLRALGWRPGHYGRVGAKRAEQEMEQAARFEADPSWRRGRIRDVVAAREILIDLNKALHEGLRDRGAELLDVFPEPSVTRAVFDAMPSFDVAVSLKASYHSDGNHRWTTNDIHDIDALGSAVPYCDIVVTDRAVASHLCRTGVDERLRTTVLSTLNDLAATL